jgi:hypothetical protein
MIAHGRILFGGWHNLRLVALLDLVRIFMEWPVMIGDWSVPIWRVGSFSSSLAWLLFGLRLSERNE